jgi:FkbM family methyltransferase
MTNEPTQEQLVAAMDAQPPTPGIVGAAPIALFGAGGKGRETLALLRQQGREVVAFLDSTSKGECDGIPILPPNDPAVKKLAHNGCTAVVTVFNPLVDPLPLHEMLQKVGFARTLGMVQARELGIARDAYWLTDSAAMTPPRAEAEWLYDNLADDQSRRTLIESIALRRTGDVRLLRSPSLSDQYCPVGIALPRKGLRMVDGGAFDGDTIVNMLASGIEFEALAAFEPDPTNYAALIERTRKAVPTIAASLWPCGLDATTRQMRFNAHGLASSGMSDRGALVIQTVSFDEALSNWRPNYIKLDIEGAEALALRGMADTIQRVRPAVAVCIYHKPADLWELPRLIDNLLPDSNLYIRSHAWNGFDLVLYAVPREMQAT